MAAAIFKAASSLNFPKTSASILWKSSFLNVLVKTPFSRNNISSQTFNNGSII
jgi:hypothetical protein